MTENTLKVYVDTCILSKLWQETIEEPHFSALDSLADLQFMELVTSQKMFEEFIQTQDKKIRVPLKVMYKIIQKVQPQPLQELEGGLSFPMSFPINFGTFKENGLFTQLKQIFDEADSEHIFQAIKSNCDYFLTMDRKTILKRVPKHQEKLNKLCPSLNFVDPATLLEKIKDINL